MQLRHRVALDGVQLDEVDSRIMIQKVDTGEGKENLSAVNLWGRSGSRVTSEHRESIEITVKFCIRLKKRDMAERETVLEKANAWACNGGWLTVNYKENRKIRVFMAKAAVAGDPWEWTKEYEIVFQARGVPYWQEYNPTTVRQQNVSSANMTLGVNGSAQTACEVQFKNTSGSTVNTFAISTGESAMAFASLGLGNNETLVIDHDDNGKKNVLRIRIQSTGGVYRSALDKRTALTGGTPSSNDLYVTPGSKTITASAGGAGTLTVSCSGRFA